MTQRRRKAQLEKRNWLALSLLLTCAVAALVGCGGGGAPPPTPPPTPPPGPPPLSLTTTSLPTGVKDQAYSANLRASGGTTPYSWDISSGVLPEGLTLNSSTGQISGTLTTEGTTSFTVRVTDSSSPPRVATRSLSIEVVLPLLVTTTSLPSATVGVAYSAQLEASGGKSPITWSLSSGTLPADLTLNTSTGVISGTPSRQEAQTFTVQARDSSSTPQTDTQDLGITVVPPGLLITTTRLPDTTGGKFYDFTLASQGGISPVTWEIPPEALPTGLELDPATGRISGTVNPVPAETTVNFTMQASDSGSETDTQPLSITVRADPPGLGRNDACPAGAVPISNGSLRASLSPYGDIDVYSFQGTAGQLVTIETIARRLAPEAFTDTVVELLDSACSLLIYNDDIDLGIIQDSLILNFSLPYTGTYYIRVRDFRGDGRPDLIYELRLSGAN